MRMPELTLPEGVESHFGSAPEQVAALLADTVANFLSERLDEVDRASLVVSGGSTPIPFFEVLASKPLPWERVDVLLADERWVGEDDPASNTRLVRRHLLQGPAARARYLSLKQPGSTPEEGIPKVMEELADVQLPLDVLVLGMGNDGHTASLFPDAPQLDTALDPGHTERAMVMTPASQPQRRITLTYSVLADARLTVLHLKGSDKLATLRQACRDLHGIRQMPVRAFIKPGLKIFWSP